MDKTECLDRYSEPETEEHLNGKRLLYEWIKKQDGVTNAVLEGWLPETKQRPDIMFNYHGKKCVIEYQCSPISSEYYDRRDLYQSAGIKDIWICGTEKYIQCLHKGNGVKRLNTLEECCGLYFNSTTKQFYKIDSALEKKDFEKIYNGKKYVLMKNIYDYVGCNLMRYIFVKDNTLNYDKTYRYPSPTGRPSNKYPYPVAKLEYRRNVSLARCFDLDKIKLTEIK